MLTEEQFLIVIEWKTLGMKWPKITQKFNKRFHQCLGVRVPLALLVGCVFTLTLNQ